MIGIIIVTSIALVLSIIICLVDKENDKAKKIEELLPGYNCGSCGFGSCMGMAEAILKDKNAYEKCKFLKDKSLEELKIYLNK